MGANYDLIISSADATGAVITQVEQFLSDLGVDDISVSALDGAEIGGAFAVLLGPLFNGHIQVVAENRSLGVPIGEWFKDNCLAKALSNPGKVSFHFWSLDSGFVTGYSAYVNGRKVEGDVVSCKYARNVTQLLDAAPAPTRAPGDILGTGIGSKRFDFSAHMQQACSFEVGLGEIVSRFGFSVHLVDVFEALDEQEGIAIGDGEYRSVPLTRWTAIRFVKR